MIRRFDPKGTSPLKGFHMPTVSHASKSDGTICVAGANGFLGKAIVGEFVRRGFKVIALTRENCDPLETGNQGNIFQIRGTIHDWVAVIKSEEPRSVISVDWAGVAKESRDDLLLQQSNIERVSLLAQAAKDSGVQNFIAFGSQAEVGPSENLILESARDEPQNSYGDAKIETRKQVQSILEEGGTRFIWGRVFTIYGPGDVRESVVSELIKSLLANQTFTLKFPLKKWSFLAIQDFVEAVYILHESLHTSGVINIGHPEHQTIETIADQLSEIYGLPNKILKSNLKNPDYSHLTWIPETSTLSKLSWSPKIPLNLGLANTLRWWEQISIQDGYNS